MGPAQRAWDQQQAFVSNASHELRTPLTLIRATAEYGLRSNHGPPQRELLQDILGETDYMNRLVDDLLLLSRLDSHRLKLERTRISTRGLLQDIGQKTEKLAASQNIRLHLDETEGEILGDPDRMRQLLLILLDNALRYTEPGGEIHLGTTRQGGQVQISVRDNGIGISAEYLPHLFERFYQVRSSTSSDENRSNGLGLSIAKGLVEAQGGSIRIESQPGQGTRVIVSMPAA
jgi:signal transduction histidine kinase